MSDLRFLNVDLELRADFDLAPLVATLSGAGLLLMSEETVPQGLAAFELALDVKTPEEAIDGLLAVLATLPEQSRAELSACKSITFDAGFAPGSSPHSISSNLPPKQIRTVAAIGGSLNITLYAIEKPGS